MLPDSSVTYVPDCSWCHSPSPERKRSMSDAWRENLVRNIERSPARLGSRSNESNLSAVRLSCRVYLSSTVWKVT